MTTIRFMDRTPGYQKPECLEELVIDDEDVVIEPALRLVHIEAQGRKVSVTDFPANTTHIEIALKEDA